MSNGADLALGDRYMSGFTEGLSAFCGDRPAPPVKDSGLDAFHPVSGERAHGPPHGINRCHPVDAPLLDTIRQVSPLIHLFPEFDVYVHITYARFDQHDGPSLPDPRAQA